MKTLLSYPLSNPCETSSSVVVPSFVRSYRRALLCRAHNLRNLLSFTNDWIKWLNVNVAIIETQNLSSFAEVFLILILNISALRSHPGMMLMFPNSRLNSPNFARSWLVLCYILKMDVVGVMSVLFFSFFNGNSNYLNK